MILYFLRHASAGEHRMDPAKDEKRPLDREGFQQCYQVARMLASMDVSLDSVISSPLKRALQTAALVANELAYDGKIHIESALRPGANYDQFRDMLRKYARSESLLLVGHNPNISEFLSRSVEMDEDGYIELRKGAIARVLEEQRGAALEWLITPRLVRAVVTAAASELASKKKAEELHIVQPAMKIVDLRNKKKLSRTERALSAFAKKKLPIKGGKKKSKKKLEGKKKSHGGKKAGGKKKAHGKKKVGSKSKKTGGKKQHRSRARR
jgi:phosphohistidine phosphatase